MLGFACGSPQPTPCYNRGGQNGVGVLNLPRISQGHELHASN